MHAPNHLRLKHFAIAAAALATLAACGGGDDSSDEGTPSPSPTPTTSVTDPIRAIKYDDAIVATTTQFNNSDAAFCNPNSKAYAGINTITYAENGVSDKNHRTIAIYAEASARYIKSKLELDQSTEGFGDNEIISVCAKNGSIKDGSGSGYHNRLEVNANFANDDIPYDQPGDNLKRLVLHEMIHVTHSRLANCPYDNYGLIAKWFSEGSALLLAGQDQYYTDDLNDYRKMAPANPYDWIENGMPIWDRYPIYRLATESLVLENGYQVDDVWKFTKAYFAAHNQCDANGYQTFNQAISDYFKVDLKNGYWVQNFWTSTLDKYALDE